MLSERSNDFAGQTLGIATCHGKESQIGPILSEAFGFDWVVPAGLFTDNLGTFTGERARLGDPLEVARQKIAMGKELLPSISCWVASEGSFGPHPTLGFLPVDEEWLVFQDFSVSLEVCARAVSFATNYRSAWLTDWPSLKRFAESVQFPSHGIILRPGEHILAPAFKGIQDEVALQIAFQSLQKQYGGAYAMTDMRAMMNPSRQMVIQEASTALVQKLQSLCPECARPGYSIQYTTAGLPCAWCGLPTRSALEAVWYCSQCQFSNTQPYPLGRTEEDPGLCDVCNP